jgi:Protein of unknown function (DUF3567)
MHMIYNSPNFCVVEFKASNEASHSAGFEIMDKTQRREIFLDGVLADQFRRSVDAMFGGDPDPERIDAFLRQFEGLMQQPLTLH